MQRVIPACVIKTIRDTFSEPDGMHVGFKAAGVVETTSHLISFVTYVENTGLRWIAVCHFLCLYVCIYDPGGGVPCERGGEGCQ